ncbi:N-acetyltransferase family protein [Micromonospora sp. IBHARD004]|uniref:N-acetyltransferase family protein n=1 Tax=Micromonospora sp. IBHARD004 TaxID=3457764 RepID=UPI004057DEC1
MHTLVREIAMHEGDDAHVTVTAARWADLLGRDDVTVLLAERAGEPLGYVSAHRRLHLWSGRDILALDDLLVRAPARDAGVGRGLMLALARTAADDGLVIRWEVKPENTGAQRFYRRLGAGLPEGGGRLAAGTLSAAAAAGRLQPTCAASVRRIRVRLRATPTVRARPRPGPGCSPELGHGSPRRLPVRWRGSLAGSARPGR